MSLLFVLTEISKSMGILTLEFDDDGFTKEEN